MHGATAYPVIFGQIAIPQLKKRLFAVLLEQEDAQMRQTVGSNG